MEKRRNLVLAVLLLAVAGAARAAPDTREEGVLAALEEAFHGPLPEHWNSRDFLMTSIERRREAAAGRRLYVPVLPPHCGLTEYGALPREDARRLLIRLFAAYGYDLLPDRLVEVGGRTIRVDALDEEWKVGVLFVPEPVEGAAAPAAQDAGRLGRAGHRVLALPLASYRSAQNDPVTPLFACALSAIDFLDEITNGEDVDPSPLATGSRHEVPLPGPVTATFPTAPSIPGEGGLFVVATGAGRLAWKVDPRSVVPKTNRRAPGLVVLPFYWTPPLREGRYDFSGPRPQFRLTQTVDGTTLSIDSSRPFFVVPETFDPTRTFEIRIDGPAGQYHFGTHVGLTTAGPR